ncbi:MAG: peptidase S8, partial [Wenzhouxiangella sp.]
MKNLKRLVPALVAAAGLTMGSAAALADDNRYIIQFAPGGAGQGKAAVQALGGEIKVDLTNRGVNAVAVSLPAQALNGLQNNPNVVQIEPDSRVYLMADEVPYGITMVQADQVLDGLAGNRTICVIDSGYYIGHNDLQTENVTATPDSGS